MGACFDSIMIRAKDRDVLRSELRQAIQRIEDQYGRDSYNGKLSTCNGLKTYSDMKFKTRKKAEEWIEERAEKRQEMIAVKCSQTPKIWNGTKHIMDKRGNWWVIGGLCSC